jgi:hypothetical protein
MSSAQERYTALCERVSWFEEGAACEAAVVEAWKLGYQAGVLASCACDDEGDEGGATGRKARTREGDDAQNAVTPVPESPVSDDVGGISVEAYVAGRREAWELGFRAGQQSVWEGGDGESVRELWDAYVQRKREREQRQSSREQGI